MLPQNKIGIIVAADKIYAVEHILYKLSFNKLTAYLNLTIFLMHCMADSLYVFFT